MNLITVMLKPMAQEDKDQRIDEQIDENLRRVYKAALDEDVPERFQELIRKLKAQDTPK